MRLDAGDQVVADGAVVTADALALDEANLTGSPSLWSVIRRAVWSGSFAVEGARCTRQRRSGRTAASRLTATVDSLRPRSSGPTTGFCWDCSRSIPLAVALVATAFSRVETAAERVSLMTAGIVNLVPEGLILLISLTAAVSAFKMAKRGVLAQQLNAVESLASVDVVCTDKTGTLTEAALRRGIDSRRRW